MPSETDPYHIEQLSAANLNDLEKLYHAVYGSDRTTPDYVKKYATAWTGAEYIGYFAYDANGTPAAYYGVIPCLLQYGADLLLSAQSGDTMTHPNHRGKGLFARLCNKTIELSRQKNIRLLFGFPNNNSYPGFVNKLGWTVTETLDCFQIAVTTLPLIGLVRRFPFLKSAYSTYANSVLKRVRTADLGITSSNTNCILHDRHWFQYKTYSPTLVIRIGTAKAWIKLTDTFTIGDIGLPDPASFNETLRSLRRLAAKLGYRQLFFHSSPGTTLHRLFAVQHKPFPSFPVIFKDLGSGARLDQFTFTFSDIDTF